MDNVDPFLFLNRPAELARPEELCFPSNSRIPPVQISLVNTSSSSHPPGTESLSLNSLNGRNSIPQLKSTVFSANGSDITSSFQTLVFWAPQPTQIVAIPGLTDREQSGIRSLSTCSSSTASFVGSHCDHQSDIRGSLQRYVIYCRENQRGRASDPSKNTSRLSRLPRAWAEPGGCESDEVCMPGAKEKRNGVLSYTARCVKKNAFRTVDWIESVMKKEGWGRRMASVVLSRTDEETPLEAKSIEADALEAGAPVQKKSCTNCTELRTPALSPKSDALTVEAWLEVEKLKTLQTAGILWLIVQVVAAL